MAIFCIIASTRLGLTFCTSTIGLVPGAHHSPDSNRSRPTRNFLLDPKGSPLPLVRTCRQLGILVFQKDGFETDLNRCTWRRYRMDRSRNIDVLNIFSGGRIV